MLKTIRLVLLSVVAPAAWVVDARKRFLDATAIDGKHTRAALSEALFPH